MARIPGVEPHQAGLFTRLAYRIIKSRIGRVILPIKIAAHHPRLFWATLEMERGQAGARTISAGLKALVQLKVAMMIGCPF